MFAHVEMLWDFGIKINIKLNLFVVLWNIECHLNLVNVFITYLKTVINVRYVCRIVPWNFVRTVICKKKFASENVHSCTYKDRNPERLNPHFTQILSTSYNKQNISPTKRKIDCDPKLKLRRWSHALAAYRKAEFNKFNSASDEASSDSEMENLDLSSSISVRDITTISWEAGKFYFASKNSKR